ncbi:MAG: CDP-alcohol phosphatidyltransferase family protein [Cyclobacteriaceae bacterium]
MDYNFDKFYKKWVLISAIIHLIGLTLSFTLGSPAIWVTLTVILFGIYLIKITYHLPALPLIYGYANWVSILRLLMVLTAFSLHNAINDIYLFSIFTVSIVLDGFDGFLARKFNQETPQGAILDMETDALMVLVLAYIHISNAQIPAWILLPASFRYIYAWIILFTTNDQKKELVPKIVRATIAVIFFSALLLPFISDSLFMEVIVHISGVLIMLSFASSFYFALKHFLVNKSS